MDAKQRNMHFRKNPEVEDVDPDGLEADLVEWVKSSGYGQIDARTMGMIRDQASRIMAALPPGGRITAYNDIQALSGTAGYRVKDATGKVVHQEVIWRS